VTSVKFCYCQGCGLATPIRHSRSVKRETKRVWQWRYKGAGQKHWKVASSLLTEDEVTEYYDLGECDVEKLSGPFEVTI